MVSEIVVENGTKIITLKTIIDIKNHYTKPVNVFRFDGKNGWPKVGRIEPNQTFNVPLQAVYSEPYEFSFQICGECKFIYNSQHNQIVFDYFQTYTAISYGHSELSREEKSKFEFEEKKFSLLLKVSFSRQKRLQAYLFSIKLNFFSSNSNFDISLRDNSE